MAKGPFTVFAPTNEAFSAVDSATLDTLLKDIDLLKRVLTYHVVAASLPASAIQNEQVAKTLAGDSLRVNIYGPSNNIVIFFLHACTFDAILQRILLRLPSIKGHY